MFSDGATAQMGWRRVFRNAVLFAGISILLLLGRLTVLSAQHYRDAEAAKKNGRYETALKSYNEAIKNYYPGSPYSYWSAQKSLGLIDAYRAEGKTAEEELALRDAQAAFYSIRSFYQPYRESLRAIEERMTRIEAQNNGVRS
ncbi:MAG: hypothetical protein AB1656_22710 [Candidatus Omnitrophota bacterium]